MSWSARRAYPGTGAEEGIAPRWRAHAGAGRGRPHARHGLRGSDPRHRQAHAQERQGLLFGDVPDAIRTLGHAMLREAMEVSIDGGAQPAAIEQWFYEADPRVARRCWPRCCCAIARHRRWCSATPAPTPRKSSVRCRTTGSPRCAAWRHGPARSRRGAGAVPPTAAAACWSPATSPRAARCRDIGAVVNHELPTDADTYLHRIGCTGRAGAAGWR